MVIWLALNPAEPGVRGLFFTAGGAALLLAAAWTLVDRWILRPLDRIGRNPDHSPAPSPDASANLTELDRLARLVDHTSRQQAELAREVEERRRTEEALRESETRLRQSLDLRARLARDLHDGVIQSIYAAGLGLEGAMAQLARDPEAARARLQHCRQSLNDVIRDVRGFISGLEHEAMHHQDFGQEIATLVRTMQALWPVHIQVQLAPAVIERLSATQELHALQICRESISNAVRHGGARAITITLDEHAGQALLRIQDTGRGFDPAAVRGGSGLGNLAARARELGGELKLESQRGTGTTITVAFPLPAA